MTPSPERNACLRAAMAVRKSTQRLLRSIKEFETAREIMERATIPPSPVDEPMGAGKIEG